MQKFFLSPLVRRNAICLFALVSAFVGTSAYGEDELVSSRATGLRYPAEIIKDTRQLTPRGKGLPDGRVSKAKGNYILGAWYSDPTARYPHGALGDKIEAGSLQVKLRKGPVTQYKLPEKQVFEDIAPRLVDLDGDGQLEIITIVSSLEEGASVGIFGLNKTRTLLEVKSSSGFIGTKNRWLNIAGISNFTGKRPQIAYVETPHINGKLVIADYIKGKFLQPVVELEGFSNHVFGSNELRLSAIVDFNGDKRGDLIIPSQDRRTLHVLGLKEDVFQILASIQFNSPINKAIKVEGRGRNARFIVGLEDGTVNEVRATDKFQ